MIQIELGGKTRGLRFGNYALMTYNALTKTDALEVKEFSEEYQHIDFVRDITFCGLMAYNKVKNELVDFTIQDVTEWIDEMDLKNVEIIVKAWTDSISTSEYIKNNLDLLAGDKVEEKKN